MFHLPTHSTRKYEQAGACIYCGDCGALSDEHIIPFGLGGQWIVPKASCVACAKTTGAFEGTCQRTMLGAFRMYYSLPTRRPKERPAQLSLKVKLTTHSDWTMLDVDRDIYPFLVIFPLFDLPDHLSGVEPPGDRAASVKKLWVRAASFRDGLTSHVQNLAEELNVAAIEPTATIHAPEFFRMLAKIAHAFAVAELGAASFRPFLGAMICDGDTSEGLRFVGGLDAAEPAAPDLHELSLAATPSGTIVVRIRLFACLETPTYLVAVGSNGAP